MIDFSGLEYGTENDDFSKPQPYINYDQGNHQGSGSRPRQGPQPGPGLLSVPQLRDHADVPPQNNTRPVIGILSLPLSYENWTVNGTSYIAASYVQWVESSGTRVVPIKVDASSYEISTLVKQLNGVLFTGGTADFFNCTELRDYSKAACSIFEQVKVLNDAGTYCPLWATSLGYELLHVCVSPFPSTVGSFNGKPAYAAKVNFTQSAHDSYLFERWGGDWVQRVQQEELVSLFSHVHGISPDTYGNDANLSSFYEILATGHDLSGKQYVALIEAHKYPIYGSQFHAEKNNFEWTPDSPIPHDSHAVAISSFYSRFFISEARRNNLAFTSQKTLKNELIYNYAPYFLDAYFNQIYVF